MQKSSELLSWTGMTWRALGAAALFPWILSGQAAPEALLQKARSKVAENIERLPKYTCVQTLRRSQFDSFSGAKPIGCSHAADADAKGAPRLMLAWSDRVKLDVTVSEGAEIFSWAGAREFQSSDSQEIVGTGLTGTGDFGPFLAAVFAGSAYRYLGLETNRGRRYAAYSYSVPESTSHYQMRVGPRPGDKATLAYEGKFWIDPENAELARLTIVVPRLPKQTETCRVETTIDYQRVPIGSFALLLPQLTLLELWSADGSRFENRTEYEGCRAFQSESAFRPEIEEPSNDAAAAAPRAGASSVKSRFTLPLGISLHIALRSHIDGDSAFAGDAVEGQLQHAVRTRDGVTLAAAGALVLGRIVRFEEHVRPSRYFVVGLKFSSVAGIGGDIPLLLEAVPRTREEQPLNRPVERSQGVGVFLFRNDRLALDQRFVSEWRTESRP
jgi:hypothetical protein